MAFNALAATQILHTYACRAEAPAPNPLLSRAIAGTVALQVGALWLRPLRAALSLGTTGALDLTLAALIGAAPAALRWARSPRGRDEIVIEGRAHRPQAGPNHEREESP